MKNSNLIQFTPSRGFNPLGESLSNNPLELIRDLITLDYRGLTQQELDSISESIQRMTVYCRDERWTIGKIAPPEIFFISSIQDRENVMAFISDFIKSSGDDLTEKSWLEFEKGFMFFTNRKTFENSCLFFGIPVMD